MDKEERRCKECKSTFTYIRLRKKERVCRSCGHIEKLEEENEKRSIIK